MFNANSNYIPRYNKNENIIKPLVQDIQQPDTSENKPNPSFEDKQQMYIPRMVTADEIPTQNWVGGGSLSAHKLKPGAQQAIADQINAKRQQEAEYRNRQMQADMINANRSEAGEVAQDMATQFTGDPELGYFVKKYFNSLSPEQIDALLQQLS